jgi:hypothetical protein
VNQIKASIRRRNAHLAGFTLAAATAAVALCCLGALLTLPACSTTNPRTLYEEGQTNYPQSAAAIKAMTTALALGSPPPYQALADAAAGLAIIALGAWHHLTTRRVSRIEKNGNGLKPAAPSPQVTNTKGST